MATETIGERRRRAAAELAQRQAPFPATPILAGDRQMSPIATNLYFPPVVADRLSEQPVGRHRAEYIRSHSVPPDYLLKTSPPETAASQPANLPPNTAVPQLPQRTPFDALSVEIPDFRTSVPVLKPEDMSFPYVPATERQASPDRAVPQETERPETTTSTLVLPGDFRASRPSRPPNRDKYGITRPEPSTTPTRPPTERRSATETRIHAKTKRGRKTIALAALAAVAGVALVGGGLLFKDKKASSPSTQTSAEFSLPAVPTPPETLPVPVVKINETGTIMPQDRNQWGASANKTERAVGDSRTIIGTTNIVKDIGAYDSRGTSPDPDAAQAGDTFISLTDAAIVWVDRLQQPLGPDASAAQIDAAQIINQLNNLGPMGTKYLIDHYGSRIEALKADLITILSPQEQTQTHQAPQRVSSAEKTVYTSTTSKADALSNGKKAITALAREQQSRQRQSTYI